MASAELKADMPLEGRESGWIHDLVMMVGPRRYGSVRELAVRHCAGVEEEGVDDVLHRTEEAEVLLQVAEHVQEVHS